MSHTNWTKADLIAEITALERTINERVAKHIAKLDKEYEGKLKKDKASYREFLREAALDKIKAVDKLMERSHISKGHFHFMIPWNMSSDATVRDLPFGLTYHYKSLKQEIDRL